MRSPEVESVWEAIRSGNVAKVYEVFGQNPDLLQIDPFGRGSWLHMAADLCGDPTLCEWLIATGQSVNILSTLKTVPLSHALGRGHLQAARVLLEHGARPELSRCNLSAIQSGPDKALAAIKLLEEFGADLHKVYMNEFTNQPMNALSFARDHGYEDVVEYLLSKGVRDPERVEPKRSEVAEFFHQEVGTVQPRSLIEIVPTEPAIEIHVIKASGKDRQFITLFTSGMSAAPMQVPAGHEDYRFAELFIQLPRKWPYDDLDSSYWNWPVLWLRRCAKLPHHQDTWLGPACVISSEDPHRPLAPNTELSCVLLLSEKHFIRLDGSPVRLYRMVPLYSEERQFEIDHGTTALMQTPDNAGVSMVVDLNRPRAV